MTIQEIYVVQKWNDSGSVWNVSYCPTTGDFRCNCQRMESLGLPCQHIIVVLVILEKDELPSCLVLKRWTKKAKEEFSGTHTDGSFYLESNSTAKLANLISKGKFEIKALPKCIIWFKVKRAN
jgi:hypothetical protein